MNLNTNEVEGKRLGIWICALESVLIAELDEVK